MVGKNKGNTVKGGKGGGKGRTIRTVKARAAFIAAIRETCNIAEACRRAGIGRSSVYEWRDDDESFAAEWDEAVDDAIDSLEAEAWRRGVQGVDMPVTHKGEITDWYRGYSDRMLEVLLKGHRPEKYRERFSGEISGPGGGPLVTRIERVIIDSADEGE